MNEAIDKAIKELANRITNDVKGSDAMQLTQAALNLAHVKQVLKQAGPEQLMGE